MLQNAILPKVVTHHVFRTIGFFLRHSPIAYKRITQLRTLSLNQKMSGNLNNN